MFYLTTYSTHFIYGYMERKEMFYLTTHSTHFIYQWRRKMPKSGGAQRHVIYLPSIKNQYKRVVFGYMVIYEQPSVSVY